MPEELQALLRSYPTNIFDRLPEAIAAEPTVAIRLNPVKPSTPPAHALPVDWCSRGYYLDSRPQFTFDPLLHQGAYYVQDASSMFIAHVIAHLTDPAKPVRYLDACAAPGGKTTAALSVLPQGSLLVANEFDPRRASILRENLTKWGVPAVVTQGDTARFTQSAHEATFDIIAADVPCSGEGMMRKDPVARAQWSPRLIDQCVDRQRQIIANLWPAIAPGGFLIYSTCTFNRLENEEMVAHIIDAYGALPVAIPTDPAWGISPAIDAPFPAYRFIPGITRGEGLFMAILQKPADDSAIHAAQRRSSRRHNKSSAPAAAIPKQVSAWLADPSTPLSLTPAGTILAHPVSAAFPDFPYQPAVEIATLKGRDAIPAHPLALSTILSPGAFPTHPLDLPQAIAYLRAEAITLPPEAPRGFILLTYKNLPLGFVKNLPNRANNLYPRPWRILSNPQ